MTALAPYDCFKDFCTPARQGKLNSYFFGKPSGLPTHRKEIAMSTQKRVAAIHDISCFGRCSLTVALPIISAAGIETSVVPTAVLSTHTGGIPGYTFRDLTEDILPIVNHWHELGLHFDAIYTGFLGSKEQIELVSTAIDQIKSEDTLIVVDPVMADNGKLYAIFPADFPAGMRTLCSRADVLVPNITEACLLLDRPYEEGPYTKAYIEDLLKALAELGPKKVVLTGVFFDEDNLGAAGYDAATGQIDYFFAPRIEGYYHGTGDVFGSAMVAALLSGTTLARALELAVEFTTASIQRTKDSGADIRFGVNFEAGLGWLARQLNLI
jgi:pyridoxine kinase